MRRRFAVLMVVLGITVLGSAGCASAPQPAQVVDGVQAIRVSAQGTFTPAAVAKAGTPIRLEFGPGGGCTAAVKFAELGVFEDLTDGGGVVNLPALEPGEYPLVCQADMVMGVLRVE